MIAELIEYPSVKSGYIALILFSCSLNLFPTLAHSVIFNRLLTVGALVPI